MKHKIAKKIKFYFYSALLFKKADILARYSKDKKCWPKPGLEIIFEEGKPFLPHLGHFRRKGHFYNRINEENMAFEQHILSRALEPKERAPWPLATMPRLISRPAKLVNTPEWFILSFHPSVNIWCTFFCPCFIFNSNQRSWGFKIQFLVCDPWQNYWTNFSETCMDNYWAKNIITDNKVTPQLFCFKHALDYYFWKANY